MENEKCKVQSLRSSFNFALCIFNFAMNLSFDEIERL